MKANVEFTPVEIASDATVAAKSSGPLRVLAYLELTKPRVTFLVLLTTVVGFYMASLGGVDSLLLLQVLVGTALVAAGTAVLNQVMEREEDARMWRTARRPLPSGRLGVGSALVFGCLLVLGGSLYLAVGVNLLSAVLAGLTASLYLLAYTPLKTRTPLCTLVGAVPGAIPPLIGWAAVRGQLEWEAWVLFAILFVWQFPHFLSISWIYREDYERGGFKMLPVLDRDGSRTTRRMVLYTLMLVPIGVLPWWMGLSGSTYLVGAILLGLGFAAFSWGAAWSRSREAARRVLKASVAYLPLLLILMAADKM